MVLLMLTMGLGLPTHDAQAQALFIDSMYRVVLTPSRVHYPQPANTAISMRGILCQKQKHL